MSKNKIFVLMYHRHKLLDLTTPYPPRGTEENYEQLHLG
jgi:hypothetical protein